MFRILVPFFLAATAVAAAPAPGRLTQSLAGDWRFELDPNSAGLDASWFSRHLADTVYLPGTTATNHKGTPNKALEPERLTERWPYVGKAWYQRDIDIPGSWRGKRVELLLERTKATRVWLDGHEAGAQQLRLFTPHRYDLTLLATPGTHRLTILVDNGYPFPVAGHALSPDTQTNWNGIIGRLELIATDAVWIESVRATPDPERHRILLEVETGNSTGHEAYATLTATAGGSKTGLRVRVDGARHVSHFELPAGSWARGWDEFTPALTALRISLDGAAGQDSREMEIGFRRFARDGARFTVNGRRVMLRGKHEGAVFPLTGYPPMEVDAWTRYFRTLKEYGLNHVRFHSWTPPDAAFTAADREGFYLLTELPLWGLLPDPKLPGRAPFLMDEGIAILDAYANHPSFCLLTLGNELSGDREFMRDMVARLRRHDPRPLYATGTNAFFNDPRQTPGDDFWVTMRTRRGEAGRTRASFSHADLPLGHIETGPPNTEHDFSAALAGVTVPVIGHETGQYEVYPNFDEPAKYSGVLEARNFTLLREKVEKAGLFPLWRDFFRASGELAVLCYREEIEAALRTRGFGGFELLDLQDYPGQGTALIGILDAFLDSKGLITPARWRRFCSAVVPLLRFPKYTWTRSETFSAAGELSNFGPADLRGTTIEWRLRDAAGAAVRSGTLPVTNAPQGDLTALGRLQISLAGLPVPARYDVDVELRLPGAGVRNSYPLWVYPDTVHTKPPAGVTVARELNDEIRRRLQAGESVLLLPPLDKLPGSLPVLFMTDFWCFPMFDRIARSARKEPSPGTMGLLIDPRHPALARFPSEFYTNWQWWRLVKSSRAMILDGEPQDFRPIVRVIDNAFRNHTLALLEEKQDGAGKLLVCSIDLPALQDYPEARQLMFSLLEYLRGANR